MTRIQLKGYNQWVSLLFSDLVGPLSVVCIYSSYHYLLSSLFLLSTPSYSSLNMVLLSKPLHKSQFAPAAIGLGGFLLILKLYRTRAAR